MALEDELLRQRSERITEIEKLGFRPYGQAFAFTHTVPQILSDFGSKTAEELAEPVHVRIAGRIMRLRRMGKVRIRPSPTKRRATPGLHQEGRH